MSVSIKTSEEIDKMRVAGRLASELLDFITPHVRPGVTTGELDRIAHDYQVNVQHVVPATLNWLGTATNVPLLLNDVITVSTVVPPTATVLTVGVLVKMPPEGAVSVATSVPAPDSATVTA